MTATKMELRRAESTGNFFEELENVILDFTAGEYLCAKINGFFVEIAQLQQDCTIHKICVGMRLLSPEVTDMYSLVVSSDDGNFVTKKDIDDQGSCYIDIPLWSQCRLQMERRTA